MTNTTSESERLEIIECCVADCAYVGAHYSSLAITTSF